ncbi:MAG: hypothetical protein K8R54_10045 [Bacteroidales bacterium]|nr:hypothetical protein [Bacteroidales bacterium]
MNNFKTYILIIAGFIFYSETALAQETNESSLEIQVLFEKLFYAQSDSSKDSINKLIISKLEVYLFEPENDYSELESLKNLYVVNSEDKYIYIFTWATLYSGNKYKYFGFVKYYSKEMRKYYVEKLNHHSKGKDDITNRTIMPDDWYGSVYYSLIYKKYKGKRQYILLGWDGNDQFTNKKIIDIIVIEEGEIPVFGEDVFKTETGFKKRLFFEYAERVTMTLRYDKDFEMIIWDHLSPSKQELVGHYEYYGPDMTYDGFIFEKGIWKFISDVDLN